MTKAKFIIHDKVQNVGYRVLITQKILEHGLEGIARNIDKNKIEVLVEGDKDTIMRFYEDMKKEKPKLAENPIVDKIQFDIKEPIPNAMRSSQALVLNQMEKGVEYLEKVSDQLWILMGILTSLGLLILGKLLVIIK